jgi:hypothetical protein
MQFHRYRNYDNKAKEETKRLALLTRLDNYQLIFA